ncbi:hypothetical protein B0F90DRAFT_1701472 [Multifurca ochricompacta]|uniref:F-box domain-containing protein n=1 Tax=Multifurca ochricompacta TaxID=376703 RepID=A0AAD4M787_9AGAM|nr:hypothetical protein B0F90DRAFT_1701472 [Multifurca ochricompacta]
MNMNLSSTSSLSPYWLTLPVEIQLTITQLLDINALHSLSLVSHHNYTLCLPALYNSVTLSSLAKLQCFLDHVSVHQASHIRTLHITTTGPFDLLDPLTQQATCSDALRRLISITPRLTTLSLHLSTELSPSAISSFSTLDQLSDLSIEPCQEDAIHSSSLTERTVMAIALALPNLKSLSISRITRALPCHSDPRHSPPSTTPTDTSSLLAGGNLHPAPPILPSLFSIPTLTHLAIHNTFLGDPLFASADLAIRSNLDTLEIGAFENAAPAENARWATHILQRAGSNLRGLVLSSGILLPTENLSLPALEQCLTVDIEDVCEELSECVEHVNGGPYNLKLRLFPALEGDILAEHPVTSDCVPVASLDKNAQDALSRLEVAFSSAGAPISIVGTNPEVLQQEEEEQDWDDLTVVDEIMDIKGSDMTDDPWVQVGAW